ncbi:MAG: ABC transporter permease subunit [Caulobacter sp.]|nr:ABC transporter permease subunit [Caulobacter sp.]
MLADAFAAERLRFLRARGTIFWSVLFVPLVGVALAIIQGLFMRGLMNRVDARPPTRAVYLLNQAVESVSSSNFFLIQVFFLIAAAAILAGDYRWETWRLLTPRNTRANLMLGKLATFGLVAAAGLVLLAVSGVLSGLVAAGMTGGNVAWARDGGELIKPLAGVFVAAWLEMMVLGALAAVVAVSTRAGLATILVPVALWIVQAFILGQASGRFADPMAPPLPWLIGSPALAADMLKAALQPASPGFTPPTVWPIALAGLTGWIAGLTGLAVWLFGRQDLTRE